MHDVLVEVEDFIINLETEDMTENDHELTIDDLESERKQD